ncbi:MAG: glycosyltransferase [Chloroflexota bacterium]|nr:glycosyltransferase [Chloroflexota bacterium]
MTTTGPPTVKIAYILKMFPRFSETFILGEILELEREGVDIRIYSLKHPNDGRTHADVLKVRAPVTYVPVAKLADARALVRPHWEVFRWDPMRYLRVAFRVAKRRRWGAVKRFLQAGCIAPQLRREGITHVHAHFASSATSVAHYLHHLCGMSYSFTAHAKDIYIDSVSDDVLVRKMERARFVVTVSDFNKAHLSKLAPNVPIERIYNGLDLTQFSPNGTHADETPMILAVGRLVEKKGFDDLVRACALLRDRDIAFRCDIVGTGSEEPMLRGLIQDLHLQDVVHLTGPMPREELVKLYPRASVVVAPCVIGNDGNRDGLPTVLIEAMALGVPVVSTPVTGIPELVCDGETGLLVAPNDPVELSGAIAAVLADPLRARTMAEAGRALVEEQFDLRRNVAQLRAHFEGVNQ